MEQWSKRKDVHGAMCKCEWSNRAVPKDNKYGFQVQVLKAEGLRSADFSGVKLATFNVEMLKCCFGLFVLKKTFSGKSDPFTVVELASICAYGSEP